MGSLYDKSHSLHHHCPEAFKYLKWLSLVIVVANEIIKITDDKVVESKVWDKIDDFLNFGDPVEMPYNIAGPVGEFVNRMSVKQIGIYQGNWLTNFQLNLNEASRVSSA